jgi:hypothetical protein
MELIYHYPTGPRFRHRVEAMLPSRLVARQRYLGVVQRLAV